MGAYGVFPESRTLGRVRKFGGKFHQAQYFLGPSDHEGKVKNGFEELNVPEIVIESSDWNQRR